LEGRLPSAALLRLADVDHRRREALVALDGDEIVGVAPRCPFGQARDSGRGSR
jgi:nitrite reductase/ring-hydroxylating ferredoxin subunit